MRIPGEGEPLWETSGLTTEDGRLERPLALADWLRPDVVEVEGEWLRWEYSDKGRGFGAHIRMGPGLLAEFPKLADASPSAIRNYARRWGVLKICAHGLPCGHNPPPVVGMESGLVTWCYPLGWPDTCWEPLDRWRHFARQTRAMLNIAAYVHAGKPGRPEDWQTVYEDAKTDAWQHVHQGGPFWERLTCEAARARLGLLLDERLALGHVRPQLTWSGKTHEIVLKGSGLFGALTAQLLMVISRTDGLLICSGCGQAYDPKPRRPRAGTRHYCQTCRHHSIPQRDAMVDLRKRREEATRLSRQNVPIEEIAEIVGSGVSTVKRWLQG
jgi:transposase-like protein